MPQKQTKQPTTEQQGQIANLTGVDFEEESYIEEKRDQCYHEQVANDRANLDVVDIADIPFDVDEPQDGDSTSDKAIALTTPKGIMLAEGLYIEAGQGFKAMRLTSMVTSYTGVKPRKVMEYAGRWLRIIGCVYAPFERTTMKLNYQTGEKEPVIRRWKSPLFKLDEIDSATGQNVILTGGGQSAHELLKQWADAGIVGDFPQGEKVEVFFSIEQREGVDESLDKRTGEVIVSKEPRNLFRVAVRVPVE